MKHSGVAFDDLKNLTNLIIIGEKISLADVKKHLKNEKLTTKLTSKMMADFGFRYDQDHKIYKRISENAIPLIGSREPMNAQAFIRDIGREKNSWTKEEIYERIGYYPPVKRINEGMKYLGYSYNRSLKLWERRSPGERIRRRIELPQELWSRLEKAGSPSKIIESLLIKEGF